MNYGKSLKYCRKTKGYTVQEIADFLKISNSTYRFMESCRKRPRIFYIYKMSIMLDFDLVKFMEIAEKLE